MKKREARLKGFSIIDLIVILATIIVILIVLVPLLGPTVTAFHKKTYTVTVTDKERITENNYWKNSVKSYYIIFCKDDEGNYYEFKNEDLFIRGKFNSSTFQNKIEIGQTYEFTVVGYRFPPLSWYENIIDFKKVS